MTNIITFKKRRDFLRVASGFHIGTYNVVLQATRSLFDDNNFYVGYTTTKKIGCAVIRNKSRRRLRAIVADVLKKHGTSGIDYVFIARSSTAHCNFSDLKRDVIYALKKINKNFENQSSSASLDNIDNETNSQNA